MPYTSWEVNSVDSLFADADIATLANNVAVLSAEIDNSAGSWTHADFELVVDLAAGTITGPVELYFETAFDGTNYTTNSLSATYSSAPGTRAGAFSVNVNTSVRCILRDVPVPPCKFKVFMGNKTGLAFEGSGKLLKMYRKRMKLNS